MCTVKSLQQQMISILKDKVESPSKEAIRLIMHILGVDEIWIMLHQDEMISNVAKGIDLAKKRAEHIPLEYLTKTVSFYSENFFIDYGALIPRPETELLIDEVVSTIGNLDADINIMEVGVGSGVVSIILAKKLKNANIFAVDISDDALKIAQKNIALFGMQDKIKLYKSSFLDDMPKSIDYVVSNPPYIAYDAKLEKNLDYEPKEALFGGNIGCEILLELLEQCFFQRMKHVSCEMGYDQKEAVETFVSEHNGLDVRFYKDLSHHDRGFTITRR